MQAAPAGGAATQRVHHDPIRRDLPPVDEHMAMPETREQYFDGKRSPKMSSKPPHAIQHHRLTYVLEAHVGEDYLGAVDMLTRTGHKTDFGPDASVFPVPDPKTGKRQIEELAFEVCSEQSLSVPGDKARRLLNRGVRRVFCIVVGGPGHSRRPKLKGNYVAEWSQATNGWSPLSADSAIQDRCLHSPMPIRALLDATVSDDAVVEALRARGNRAIQKIQKESKAEGLAEGEAKMLVLILEARGLAVSEEIRQRILGCHDLPLLERWARRALVVDAASDLWEES